MVSRGASVEPELSDETDEEAEAHFHPRQRLAILLEGLAKDGSVAEVCRRHQIDDALLLLERAALRGVSATLVNGGIRGNVIPTEAKGTLNIRTLPGASIDSVVRRLERAVNDSLVAIEAAEGDAIDPPASSFDSPMFAAIAESAKALNPVRSPEQNRKALRRRECLSNYIHIRQALSH